MGDKNKVVYKRILLKLSGEALLGKQSSGVDPEVANYIATEIKSLADLNVQIGIVVGGGNIFRGLEASSKGMDRTTADYMGMLATVINSLAMQDSLEKLGTPTRVMTAIEMRSVAEPYMRRKAIRHLEKKRVIIIAAGTGNPFFTTDTAAGLRAIEIGAEVLLKATRVDGVYTSDPEKDPNAKRIGSIGYQEVVEKQLRIMDLTAISLCMDNKMPIIVFNLFGENAIRRIVSGENIGTKIS